MDISQILSLLERVAPFAASAVALVTGVLALLSKRKEVRVNVADKAVDIAGEMMDRLRLRVEELESQVKTMRAVNLELDCEVQEVKRLNMALNEQVQILTKKVNHYEEERTQWLDGARRLEYQVVKLGEEPAWHPPEEA